MFGWLRRKKRDEEFFLELAERYAAGQSRIRIVAPLATLEIELEEVSDPNLFYGRAAAKFTRWISEHADPQGLLQEAQKLTAQSSLLIVAANVFTHNRNANFVLTCMAASLHFFPVETNMKSPMLAGDLHLAFGRKHPDLEHGLGMSVVNWLSAPSPTNLALVCAAYIEAGKTVTASE